MPGKIEGAIHLCLTANSVLPFEREPRYRFDRLNVAASEFDSCSRSHFLTGRPPPKPVSAPLLPITRWQGNMIGIGLRPFAAPTARTALGEPTLFASSA